MFAGIWVSDPATFAFFFALRHPFQTQPDLQITPIEKIRLPLRSGDERPPILAGLQWIWAHPTLKAEISALLENKILAGKKADGRTGMNLWQIPVLGVVRLGLEAGWDRDGAPRQRRRARAPDAGRARHALGRRRQSFQPSNPAGQRCAAR